MAEKPTSAGQPPTSTDRPSPQKSGRGDKPNDSAISLQDYAAMRDIFWENVVRQMLMSLAAMTEKDDAMLDGRVGVLTRGGERISVARITPLFAVTMIDSREDRDASKAVQCSVFRILTPGGEVFTLPLHEIRGVHSLTPELIERLQHNESESATDENGEQRPFGFAAFRSLPKPAEAVLLPAPTEPSE